MNNQSVYPRPEYPRPDRQRAYVENVDWLNLNGPWHFRFDGDDSGRQQGWHEAANWNLNGDEQIIVPFCWESLAAWGEADAAGSDHYYATRVFRNPLEVNRSNHRSAARYEIGWYHRRIEVPSTGAWREKRAILTVGAADFLTDCWCNGVYLGRHEGGYTPFEFDLTDALGEPQQDVPDECRLANIVLRVEDLMDNHEQPVGKQWQWYTTTSGIWQTVYIEPRHASYIENFRFVPNIDTPSVQFLFNCVNAEKCNVEIEITTPDDRQLSHVLPVEGGSTQGELSMGKAMLWDMNSPFLYNVILRLTRDGHELDRIKTYFGMRKIDAAPGPGGNIVLRINGEPRYLRGALYQSYFPDGVYTATDARDLRADIEAAQKAGFNFLRVHIKIDDPILLHYADKMGMILMCDFPNFGEGGDTPTGRRRYEEMMEKAIERDFNHPSIVAWCLFNETWGFGGQVELVKLFPHLEPTAADIVLEAPPHALSAQEPVVESGEHKLENRGAHSWVQNIWQLAKSLDPTRLIEDMSVVHWEHLDYYQHGDTDINSWHFYIDDYQRAREHIEKVAADTFEGSSFNYVDGYQQQGQPLINSEYGGVGALDGNVDASWSFKFLTNELRRQGKISAYIYTELTDVEWEYNGFLTYDRMPKDFGYDPRIINSADVIPVDAPPITRRAPGEHVELDVSSSHFGTKRYAGVSLHWFLSGRDSVGRLHQDLVVGHTPIEFPHGQVAHAHQVTFELPDAHHMFPMLCTLSLCAISADGETAARNYIQYFVSDGYPPQREQRRNCIIFRAAPADFAQAQWQGNQSTRDEARECDYCFGGGTGYFEWHIPLDGTDLGYARRLRVLCEASSLKRGTGQTANNRHPTTLQIALNDLRVVQAKIADHPFDSRGALSYLRGDKGAHGYLVQATIEGDLLQEVIRNGDGNILRLRCLVPDDTRAAGGITIYGAECGRFPVTPTVIVEW